MHHSLLHLAEGEIANVTVDLARQLQTIQKGKSLPQTLLPLSEALRRNVANVQTARTEVPRTFDVLGWILTPRKAAALKSARYAIKDRLSVLFPSLCVSDSANDTTTVSKYVASEKIIPCEVEGCAQPLVTNPDRCFRTSLRALRHRQPRKWWPHLRDLTLADPNPASQEPIHLLIGVDLYGSLLSCDLRQDLLDTSTVQKPALGSYLVQ